MISNRAQRISFFPKVDAAVLQSKHEPPRIRPQAVAPIFDVEYVQKPLGPWSLAETSSAYPPKAHEFAPATIPDLPECLSERYLHPLLTRNERLRLTMLWYYTRDILKDHELLSRLQEKTTLAHDSIGWEFVIVGILDINTYTRLATFGLPLAILPRRESTCAHTIHQPPGTVFLLPSMDQDWRFQSSPHVEIGGLRSYAGAPLRFETEFGDCVGLGSLCVASNTNQEPLTKSEQVTLARLSDWIVADIVQSARTRRQRQRRELAELVATAQKDADEKGSEEPIMKILRNSYPNAIINVQSSKTSQIMIDGRGPILASDLEGGLWEDIEYLDYYIKHLNFQELPTNRVIRVIGAQCESTLVPSFLVVASKDFRLVLDDVDAWFVQTCAGILSHVWHKRLLTDAMMAKDKFLRGITHQLRTPIHGILGSAELLAEELKARNLDDSNDSTSESLELTTTTKHGDPFIYLDTIKTAGRDLITIVNSMITLNRWTDIATTERVDALHSLDELEVELFSAISKVIPTDACHKPSLFINHELPPNGDAIWVDLTLLLNCLLPLALNAIQNTPGGIVTITASLRTESRELIVDVEDTGCGIHPDHQKTIFNAYEKVDTHSTRAGLGLTLASKFASLLGGSVILVSSQTNAGSHFRATFGEVMYACSPLPHRLLNQKLASLPATFYELKPASTGVSLSNSFAKFLTHQGFISSTDLSKSFIILDFISEKKARHRCFAQIPPGQVAICLVATSEDVFSYEDVPKNIVTIRGPFLTSTLATALEQADTLVPELRTYRSLSDDLTTTLSSLKIDIIPTEDPGSNEAKAAAVPLDPSPDAFGPWSPESAPVAPVQQKDSIPAFPTIPPPILTKAAKPVALLVDDNAINLRIMQMYCNKRGLKHYSATDGLQAVELLTRHQSSASLGQESIELVLMDLQMPVCDGIEATKQIRELEKEKQWNRCVLFMVTGQDSPTDRTDAEDAGADDYFVKPVGITLLDRAVKRFFPAFKTG